MHAGLDHEAVVGNIHPVAAVCSHIENLVMVEKLNNMDLAYKLTYADLFPADIPNVLELPEDVLMTIKLHNTQKPMVAHAYSCPPKYCKSWGTLMYTTTFTAGCIHHSTSEFVSLAFIVLKSDPNVLPWWVNDYHKLNLNTISDNQPLPLASDILKDCTGHKFYAKIDMTNSFFQTQMHPDSVKYGLKL
jgi:hypothetical protein